METRGYSGLTAWQICVQSATIHADWDADDHAAYLINEEGLDEEYVEVLPIARWLQDDVFNQEVRLWRTHASS